MTISREVRCLTQEINPIQVSGEESMTLLGQLSNLQQGVNNSLMPFIKFTTSGSMTHSLFSSICDQLIARKQ